MWLRTLSLVLVLWACADSGQAELTASGQGRVIGKPQHIEDGVATDRGQGGMVYAWDEGKVALPRTMQVDHCCARAPGGHRLLEFYSAKDLTPGSLAAGVQVGMYRLRFMPGKEFGRCEATFRFDEPIVGLILRPSRLSDCGSFLCIGEEGQTLIFASSEGAGEEHLEDVQVLTAAFQPSSNTRDETGTAESPLFEGDGLDVGYRFAELPTFGGLGFERKPDFGFEPLAGAAYSAGSGGGRGSGKPSPPSGNGGHSAEPGQPEEPPDVPSPATAPELSSVVTWGVLAASFVVARWRRRFLD